MSGCSARCRTSKFATSMARLTSFASPACRNFHDPGRVEGFGLVYLEAAAGGLPSLATAIGGVPDAVLADQTGLLVAPSVEAIADAIKELAEDSDTRSVLAAGASTHARALSWERCAAKTYGLPRPGGPVHDPIPGKVADQTTHSEAVSA